MLLYIKDKLQDLQFIMARNKIDIGGKDFYKRYIKDLDRIEKNDGFALSLGTINNAVADVNAMIMDEMIYDNRFFKLPFRLGTIMILKCKPTPKFKKNGALSLPIDWDETNKLWEEDSEAKENRKFVYHRNLHTGGYLMSFKWFKTGCNVRNVKGYTFVPVKDAKRQLTAALKDPYIKVDYFEKKINKKIN